MAKRGLGRGLHALIPEFGLDPAGSSGVREVAVESIRPNPYQPRQTFDPQKMEELVASVREHGVVQPVLVRRLGDGYQLVAGERRLRAARMAGLETVPVVVQEFSESQMVEIALIENLQREDLNCIEEARAYRQLIDEFNFTQETLAQRMGKSRPEVANTLRLLNLEADIQDMLSGREISYGHARALLAIDGAARRELAASIARGGLSVREAERLSQRIAKGGKGGARHKRDPLIEDAEERLRMCLGAPVRIEHGRRKGHITIEYYGNEDLERLLEAILKPVEHR
ncbi:MAG: ParB/RepB/Spo0J family partition protein [Bacillota bacterium]